MSEASTNKLKRVYQKPKISAEDSFEQFSLAGCSQSTAPCCTVNPFTRQSGELSSVPPFNGCT